MEETQWVDSVDLNEAIGYLKEHRWKNRQRAFDLYKEKLLEVREGVSLVTWCQVANTGERDQDVEERLLGGSYIFAITQYMTYVMEAVWPEAVPILVKEGNINQITNFMYVWVKLGRTRAPEELERILCDKEHRIWWNGYAHKLCEEGLISDDELGVWMIRQG